MSSRIPALALSVFAACDPPLSGVDPREQIERTQCVFRDAGEVTCTPCAERGFFCHTTVSCGPPVTLPDGGFHETCREWSGSTRLTDQCRPECFSASDCASGETCREAAAGRCNDIMDTRRLCVP